MRHWRGVYGPRDLEILQQIFDSTWRYLERSGRVHGDEDSVRNWVSIKVIEGAKGKDLLDVDGIKASVLNSLYH
jgi:hypothetical protein